jgi:ABC-type sugar transport system permease subunit
MNVWLVLPAVTVMAVLVVIPVWLAARGYFRSAKLVNCPVVGARADVVIGRAGLAEALGRRSLRRISACSFWPRRNCCAQGCRLLADEEIMEYRRPAV